MTKFRACSLIFFLTMSVFISPFITKDHAASLAAPLKIGILVPTTGFHALQGTSVIKGFELYLQKNGNKLGGRDVKLTKADTEGKPDVALTKLKKLIEKDKMDIVVGPVSSSVALAVKAYINKKKTPLVVPIAITSALTKPPNRSPYIFRVQVAAEQANNPFGGWVIKNTAYRKMAIIASDFFAGHDAANAFKAGFEGAGGKIVKVINPKLGESDFAPYMAQLQRTGADAVYAWMAGGDAIRFDKQYVQFGLKAKLPLVGFAGLTEDYILPSVKDAAVGIITVTPYTPGIDLQANKVFVAAYKKAYKNALPSLPDANGFVSATVIDAALKSTQGKAKGDAFLKAMGSVKIDSTPRGPISFDGNGQVICDVFIARVDKVGGEVKNVVIDVIGNTRQ